MSKAPTSLGRLSGGKLAMLPACEFYDPITGRTFRKPVGAFWTESHGPNRPRYYQCKLIDGVPTRVGAGYDEYKAWRETELDYQYGRRA